MTRARLAPIAFLALASLTPQTGRTQGVPTTQPGLINIFIEEVKVGRNAEHAKNEAGWPAAAEKAKSKYNYIALTSMTGRNEAWYITTFTNHASVGEQMKVEDADAALTAEYARLSKADAEFLTNTRAVQAHARPDLSYGAFPSIGKQRFWEISWWRVKPGHEAQFEAGAKAYGAAAKRSVPTTSFRVYEVIAGLPGPTYMVFSSVANYADFDKEMANGEAIMKGATKDETAALTKLTTEGINNSETQRFRLDPTQSYVTKETKDQDPAFWNPKKAGAKP